MLAAAAAGLEVAEYSPLTIKSSVVGYGRAEKQQVQHMVTRLLSLAEAPEPMDASDALAIAICHLHTAGTLERQRPWRGDHAGFLDSMFSASPVASASQRGDGGRNGLFSGCTTGVEFSFQPHGHV